MLINRDIVKICIITNQRIIDIDKRGLFKKEVSEVSLLKIGDVFYKINGLYQTLFRFGNIEITIKDGKYKIELKNIQQPYKIQHLILELSRKISKESSANDNSTTNELVNLIKKIRDELGPTKFDAIIRELSDKKIDQSL